MSCSILTEDGIDGAGSKDARQQCANRTADAMNAKGIEGVVIAEPALYLDDHEEAQGSGDQPNQDRRDRLNEAGCLGNGCQPSDRTGDRPQRAGFTMADPLCRAPTDSPRSEERRVGK